MIFFKSKHQQSNQAGDQRARAIADRIIHWQCVLAARLNKGINRYSKQRQKWFLWIFCIASATGFVVCLVVPFGEITMNMQGRNCQPTHIGLPSDIPTKPAHLKPTDSLTTKK